MDRRTFLTTTGALGAIASAGTAIASPAIVREHSESQSQTPYIVAVSAADDDPLTRDAARRLTQRITRMSGGRLRFTLADAAGLDGPRGPSPDAHAYFGSGSEHAELAPGLAWFTGLPGRRGLSAQHLRAWIIAGGGQDLLDDYGRGLGLMPILAASSGNGGFWSTTPLANDTTALAEIPVEASGLTGIVLNRLGARLVDSGNGHAKEIPSPLTALAMRSEARFRCVAKPGLVASGRLLFLAFDRTHWDCLTPTDHALINAAAAEELSITEAENVAHQAIAWHTIAARGVAVSPLPTRLAQAIDDATASVLDDAAATSADISRIRDSYLGFAKLVCDTPATV